MDQAFYEGLIQLDVDAVLLDPGDNAIELVTDAISHECSLAPVHQLAFGIGGGALALARMIADHFKRGAKLNFAIFVKHGPRHALNRVPCANIDVAFFAAALDDFAKYSMDDQVGIAADWRRKVRVGLHRQPEVTRVPRRVTGPLHRAQHQ